MTSSTSRRNKTKLAKRRSPIATRSTAEQWLVEKVTGSDGCWWLFLSDGRRKVIVPLKSGSSAKIIQHSKIDSSLKSVLNSRPGSVLFTGTMHSTDGVTFSQTNTGEELSNSATSTTLPNTNPQSSPQSRLMSLLKIPKMSSKTYEIVFGGLELAIFGSLLLLIQVVLVILGLKSIG